MEKLTLRWIILRCGRSRESAVEKTTSRSSKDRRGPSRPSAATPRSLRSAWDSYAVFFPAFRCFSRYARISARDSSWVVAELGSLGACGSGKGFAGCLTASCGPPLRQRQDRKSKICRAAAGSPQSGRISPREPAMKVKSFFTLGALASRRLLLLFRLSHPPTEGKEPARRQRSQGKEASRSFSGALTPPT